MKVLQKFDGGDDALLASMSFSIDVSHDDGWVEALAKFVMASDRPADWLFIKAFLYASSAAEEIDWRPLLGELDDDSLQELINKADGESMARSARPKTIGEKIEHAAKVSFTHTNFPAST